MSQLPVVVDAAAVIEKHQRDGNRCAGCDAWPEDWAEHVAIALHTARVLAYAVSTVPEPWFVQLMDDVKVARP